MPLTGYFKPTSDFASCLFESTRLECASFSTNHPILWVRTIVQRFLRAGTQRAMPKKIVILYPLCVVADPLHLPSTVDLPRNFETRIVSPPAPQDEFNEDTVTVYAVRNEERGEFLDIFLGTAKNRDDDDGIYFFAIRDE